MIRILVADDHPIVRRGIIEIIQDTCDMQVIGEAVNGQDVLEKVRQNDFELLLLDISMPIRDGMDIMKEIKIIKPDLHVLVLTIHPEKNYALRMFKAGVSGYLTKERAPYELIEAIRIVSAGQKYITPAFADVLNYCFAMNANKPSHQVLSKREFQTLCLIADGKTVSEIAKKLAVSVKTVSTHRARLLEKMNMKSNAEIIRYALENHLNC